MSGDSFIREVDEELRRDRATALWKRYGPIAIGAALLIVAAVAAWEAYGWWRAARQAEDARRFVEARALLADDPQAAADAFARLADEAATGHGSLARLQAAAALAEAGDPAAEDALRGLAADGSAPETIRQLAATLAALHGLDRGTADLERLAAADHAWRHTARELRALERLRDGDRAGARELYREIADDVAAPAQLRTRAREMAAALGGGDQPTADAGPAPAVQ